VRNREAEKKVRELRSLELHGGLKIRILKASTLSSNPV